MSKKTRRYRTPNLPTSAYAAPGAEQVAPAAAAPARAAQGSRAAQTPSAVSSANWQDDYREVFGDLRRTGIIAAFLLIGMGALALVVR